MLPFRGQHQQHSFNQLRQVAFVTNIILFAYSESGGNKLSESIYFMYIPFTVRPVEKIETENPL